MKLIIQIPCYNEEKILPVTLREVPHRVEGVDKIEILVIDDGSIDETVRVAKENGADHILSLSSHQGLARAFYAGLQRSLELGADIIVNTDADNQYKASYIRELVRPILEQKADIVVGARDFKYMSKFKIFLEKLGSFIVSKMAGTDIKDTVSGFRGYSKDAAMSLFMYTGFTYTLETLVQAAKKNLVIKCVPVGTNKVERKSRLITSLFKYIKITSFTFLKVIFLYQPLKVFIWIGIIFITGGFLLAIRFLCFYFTSDGSGHIQSLIFMSVFIILGFLAFVLGIISYLIANNRRLLEANMKIIKEIELLSKKK